MKSLVAAGDRGLFLSTPAQLDASTGFVVPLTMAEQPQEIPGWYQGGFTCLSVVLVMG